MSIKISIVSVVAVVDKTGQSIGHFKKQVRQTYQLLLGLGYKDEEIEVIAPNDILRSMHNKNKVMLPFEMIAGENIRVTNMKTVLNCIVAYMRSGGKMVWFTFINDVILRCISHIPCTKKKKLIGTTYWNWNNRFKKMDEQKARKIKQGLGRFSNLLITNPSYCSEIPCIHLADYYRESDEEQLFYSTKKTQIIFVGQIRGEKNIDKLVHMYERNDVSIPLIIKGEFSDKEYFKKLTKRRYKNVQIYDINLSDKEYKKALAESKYVILPYDMRLYSDKTSGVLLDAIFVGAIPIAPELFLKNNRVKGIGYKRLAEIPQLVKANEDSGLEIVNDLNTYEYQYFVEKLKTILY